jgi:PAS domain S-box-containing protein
MSSTKPTYEDLYNENINLKKKIYELENDLELFKSIADFSYDFETLVSTNGNYVYVSPSCKNITGYSPEMFTQDKDFFESIVYNLDKQIVNEHFNERNHISEENIHIQFRILTPEKKIKWLEHCCSPAFDRSGNIIGYRASNRDITNRKTIELNLNQLIKSSKSSDNQENIIIEQLKDSNQSLKIIQDIIERNPLAIQIVDKDGHTLHVNPAHTKLFGTVPPPDYSIFNDPLIAKQNLNWLFDLVKKGEVVYFPDFYYNVHELIEEQPDNKLWLKMIVFPLFDNSGYNFRYVLMVQDITSQKLAEKGLLERNQFISSLLRAIPVAVYYKDKAGKYLGCNEVFAEFTGVNAEHLKGKTVFELWPSELSKTYHDKDIEIMNSGKFQEYEFEVKHKSGEYHPVIFAKDVYYNSENQIAGIVGAFVDISKLKNTQKKLNSALERNKALLDAIPDLMFLFDNEYRIIDYHPRINNNELYTEPENFLNKPVDAVLPKDVANITRRNVHFVLNNKKPTVFNYELEIKNKKKQYEARYVLCGENEVLSIVRDITDLKVTELELRKQSNIRQLLIQIANTYLNLSLEKLPEEINKSLEIVGKFIGADRSYVFNFYSDTDICNNTYEWCNINVKAFIDDMQNIRLYGNWVKKLKEGLPVVLEKSEQLPECDFKKF